MRLTGETTAHLVLEDVTLGLQVELVVEVLVDLALLTVLAEHAAENALPPHPEDLGRHTSLSCTLALTGTGVTSLGLSSIVSTDARAGVDSLGLDDDVAVLLEGADAAMGESQICQHAARMNESADTLGMVTACPEAANPRLS